MDTLVELQVATDLTKLARFLNSLPPLVAAVVWDVINGRVTAETVALADEVSDEEWAKYDVVRIVGACNPAYDVSEMTKVLLAEMLDKWEGSQ